MKRRDVLAGLGGAAIAGLAGCLGGPTGSTPTPDPTDSGEHPVMPTETDFAVLERPCGAGENDASVSFGADAVTVEGVIGGRDTCDTAQLVEASLHLDVLRVVVEVTPEPSTGTVACGQCLTDIRYRLRAQGLSGGPAQVRVIHRTADGEKTVAVADRP